MPLMRIEDYPPQPPRAEASQAYQQVVNKLSYGIEGIDVAYGDDIYQHIALFAPDAPNGSVLAYIHGGRWTYGYKESAAFMAPAFNAAGITFASIGHRLHPHLYDAGFADGADIWGEGPEGGRVLVKAMITPRVGRGVVWMPFHFGGHWMGEDQRDKYPKGADPYVLGEAANTAMTYGYDSVTLMQETKATLCKISAA